MAKKNAPTKPCTNCGKTVPVATRTCPHCKTAILPKKSSAKKKNRVARATKSPAAVVRQPSGSDPIDLAIRFVEQVGSLKAAKAALDKIERIKGL